jgi:hypothetical protein
MLTWLYRLCWFVARVRNESQHLYVSQSTVNHYKYEKDYNA